MFNHGFSDEMTIEEIVKNFLGIGIKGKPLKKLLVTIAEKFDERYKNLQPTYAQFSSQHLSVKFQYIIGRVIGLYDLNETQTENVKKFFWDTANAFRIVRQSKDPWPDYEIKKPNIEPQKKAESETTFVIDAKSFAEKLEVTLYEYEDADVKIDSYAYFDKEDLIVDYWKLSDVNEVEEFIRVKKVHLEMLYSKFEIENSNQTLLLKKLLNDFCDEKCFEKFKSFLNLNNIQFENNVRHDEQ
jgi:hypothetical protein